MKKYILKLIDEEIKNLVYGITCAQMRIDSGKYDVKSNEAFIVNRKKKIAIAQKNKELFLKKIK